MITQQMALDELKKESVSLYEAAIQFHQERSERLQEIEVSDGEKEARILHMKDWARQCYVR